MDFSKVILMTDLDGTLLTDDKQILPGDFEAIERFRRGGGLFTMATGRGYAMAKHIADKQRRLIILISLFFIQFPLVKRTLNRLTFSFC